MQKTGPIFRKTILRKLGNKKTCLVGYFSKKMSRKVENSVFQIITTSWNTTQSCIPHFSFIIHPQFSKMENAVFYTIPLKLAIKKKKGYKSLLSFFQIRFCSFHHGRRLHSSPTSLFSPPFLLPPSSSSFLLAFFFSLMVVFCRSGKLVVLKRTRSEK